MKKISLVATVFLSVLLRHGIAHAEEHILTVVKHSWNLPREVSILLKIQGSNATNLQSAAHGDKTRSWIQVWENVYLQVYIQGHAEVAEGEFGYRIEFSRDAAGKDRIHPIHEPRHGKTPNNITASDFVEGDKVWPAVLGSQYVNFPGEERYLDYPLFTVRLRTLEFDLIRPTLTSAPAFKSYSCLATITEKKK